MLPTGTWRVDSPVGPWAVTLDEGLVVGCVAAEGRGALGGPGPVDALRAWLAGDLTALDGVGLRLRGTPLQLAVWEALREIPAGETVSYGQLAVALGRGAGAARAVGAAVGANPVLLYVPCHRVIGGDGDLTGYAGGLSRKRWLLAREGTQLALL